MISDQLKKANIEAMKNHDSIARGIYSVVMNKLKLEEIRKREKGETLTEADEVNILQKSIKELTEEKENFQKVSNTEKIAECQKQIEIISAFLPKLMSKEEILKVILSLDDRSIPAVMKHFKANYNGKCDMRLVQEVLRGIS